MGQGVYTSLAAVIAEELDADFSQVSVEAAPPDDKLFTNPLLGFQATGGSTSIRAFWMPMRRAGAGARALLVQAAAKAWDVDPSTCRTAGSIVFHDASGRSSPYADLVVAASQGAVPQDPPLKSPGDFKLVGHPLKRLDTPDKVNGKAVYGIDAMPPGVKIATLMACPVFGGKVAHVDDSKARGVPGVRQIVVLDDLVAVVGDHMWAAKQGLDAPRHHLGRRSERQGDDERCPGRPDRRRRQAGRRRQVDRRCRQGAGERRQARGDLSCAVPGPCADGADELHGACQARCLRDLGRQPR